MDVIWKVNKGKHWQGLGCSNRNDVGYIEWIATGLVRSRICPTTYHAEIEAFQNGYDHTMVWVSGWCFPLLTFSEK